MNANQKYRGVHLPVATLAGSLGLVWARDPGLTEVADQLGHQDCALVYVYKLEGEHKPCPSLPPSKRAFQ